MRRIFKYELEVTDVQHVSLPDGAEILTVQMQHGKPCLWAIVDDGKFASAVAIRIYGTGHPIGSEDHRYIGTFQIEDGDLVFHAFEVSI